MSTPQMSPYKDELTKAMTFLAEKEDTIFIGQQIVYAGNPMSTTLTEVPKEKMIEVPVMEETQMGMSLGLAMNGHKVVSFYPRWDFLICASNQLINHLDKINIPIFGNIRFPIFQKRGSIFGYPPKALAMREFCFKYGDLLFSLKNYENKKTKLHPLGFENSQCLIGFEHSIPNNTLPIIWADKEYTKNSTKKFWQPIFPRYGDLKIDELKLIKKIDMSIEALKEGVNMTRKP
jgi:hypothetical protein